MKANIKCRKCGVTFGIEVDAMTLWQQERCTCCGHIMSVVVHDVVVRDGALDDNQEKDPDVSLAEQRMEEIESGEATSKLDLVVYAEEMGKALEKIRDGEFSDNPKLKQKGKDEFLSWHKMLKFSMDFYKKGVSQKVVFFNEKKDKKEMGKKVHQKGNQKRKKRK